MRLYAVIYGAYFITGNKRHYPQKTYVVSPSEMLAMMKDAENNRSEK